MIELNSHWTSLVKQVAEGLNIAIKTKNSELVKNNIIKLMNMLKENSDSSEDDKIAAAWCFAEISEKHPKFVKPIVKQLDNVLEEDNTLILNHIINTYENLLEGYPDLIVQRLPKIAKCIDTFDPSLRRNILVFFRNLAEKTPEYIKEYPEVMMELKISASDMDPSVSSIAKDILNLLK